VGVLSPAERGLKSPLYSDTNEYRG
jgi:hypothetical protein